MSWQLEAGSNFTYLNSRFGACAPILCEVIPMRRREFLGAVTASIVAGKTAVSGQAVSSQAAPTPPARKGRIKQGVTRGVFTRGTSLDDCCRDAARLGIKGFDLMGREDWPTRKKY
jgi:hydroxypyruvate isomerase